MFIGIVEECGEVIGCEVLVDVVWLIICGLMVIVDVGYGDLIVVNGVCLMVVDVLFDG